MLFTHCTPVAIFTALLIAKNTALVIAVYNMVRNPAVAPESKPKSALFFLKLGGYLPEWHIFQKKKWIPFTGYFTEISGWVCSVLST